MVTIDGQAAFGYPVNLQMIPNANAQQVNEFFGVNGRQTLFGGSRGRVFLLMGVISAIDVPTLNAVEANLLSFADGQPHVLIDNRGREWDNVIFKGVYQPSALFQVAGVGWGLSYKAELDGLT
jgi:hypothetical protein